jgi:hypothetical protein
MHQQQIPETMHLAANTCIYLQLCNKYQGNYAASITATMQQVLNKYANISVIMW